MKHGQMGTDRSSGPGTPLLGRVHDNSFLWVVHHRYTCAPHPEPSSLLPPHTIPLGRPSALAPSIQYRLPYTASLISLTFSLPGWLSVTCSKFILMP